MPVSDIAIIKQRTTKTQNNKPDYYATSKQLIQILERFGMTSGLIAQSGDILPAPGNTELASNYTQRT